MISELVVPSAQTVHRSCVKISTTSKRTKTSFQLSFITYEYHRVRPKRYLSLWYVWRKQCTYLALTLTLTPSLNGPIEVSQDPLLSEPVVCLAQIVHLSCTNTNTISKETKRVFHRVRPKQFPSLWYVRRKPCTNLASKLALSTNGSKQASS